MEDYMLIEYLKNKGIDSPMSEEDLVHLFKQFMRNYNTRKDNSLTESYMKYHTLDDMPYKQPGYSMTFNKYNDPLYKRYHMEDTDMPEQSAIYIVEKMCHFNKGKKYTGEVYDIEKAKEIYNMYKHTFLIPATVSEVYIAINALYHDYCKLYKQWFGEKIDNKIIESAIEFWFKDVDYKEGSKVQKYFY